MNETLQETTAKAFEASARLRRELEALVKRAPEKQAFVEQAYELVARAGSLQYRVRLGAYKGQRGFTIGEIVGKDMTGEPQYVRTTPADNCRKWVQRNIKYVKGKPTVAVSKIIKALVNRTLRR